MGEGGVRGRLPYLPDLNLMVHREDTSFYHPPVLVGAI